MGDTIESSSQAQKQESQDQTPDVDFKTKGLQVQDIAKVSFYKHEVNDSDEDEQQEE